MERERERALEHPPRARELALVAIGAEQRQGVGADLRLDSLRAQPGEDAIAVVDPRTGVSYRPGRTKQIAAGVM